MEMNLDTIYFDYIKNGKKLYETRIYDKKRREIKLLDRVKFTDRGNSSRNFEAIITELAYFKNFKDAIESVGIKKVLPNAKSLEDGVKLYNKFPHGEGGTFKDAAKKYGVLRMKFEFVK
jgi:ASC-1-like (ASCH) protein